MAVNNYKNLKHDKTGFKNKASNYIQVLVTSLKNAFFSVTT